MREDGAPSRTIAPISEPVIGSSLKGLRTSLLVSRTVMSRISKRSPSSMASWRIARIVGEANDLLGGHRARVDGDVDAGALEDLDRDRLVDDADREADAVHLGQHRRVEVLRVLAHGEDARARLADALALEEVGVDAVAQ